MKKTLVTLLTILAVTNVFAKPSMRVLGSSTLGQNGVTKSTFPWEINSMNDAFTLVWFDMPDGSYRHATVRVKYGSDPLTVICNGLVYKVRANDHNRNDMIVNFLMIIHLNIILTLLTILVLALLEQLLKKFQRYRLTNRYHA